MLNINIVTDLKYFGLSSSGKPSVAMLSEGAVLFQPTRTFKAGKYQCLHRFLVGFLFFIYLNRIELLEEDRLFRLEVELRMPRVQFSNRSLHAKQRLNTETE